MGLFFCIAWWGTLSRTPYVFSRRIVRRPGTGPAVLPDGTPMSDTPEAAAAAGVGPGAAPGPASVDAKVLGATAGGAGAGAAAAAAPPT